MHVRALSRYTSPVDFGVNSVDDHTSGKHGKNALLLTNTKSKEVLLTVKLDTARLYSGLKSPSEHQHPKDECRGIK